jgi:hypothetical protein
MFLADRGRGEPGGDPYDWDNPGVIISDTPRAHNALEDALLLRKIAQIKGM